MLQQDNPKLDTKVYEKLQNAIIDGEEEFFNQQTDITDKINDYNTYLVMHPIVANIFHEEKLDANKFVVTSVETEEAFETGKADEINLLD